MSQNKGKGKRASRGKATESPPVRSSEQRRSSPPAQKPPLPSCAEDTTASGVFLLLNGLLCRTADATGRFCPSDVFGSADRLPPRGVLPAPTTHTSPSPLPIFQGPADTDGEGIGFESDCSIFNTFGILTGGVLIDPLAKTFVDFSQDTPYAVPPVSAAKSSKSGALAFSDAQLEEVRRVHEANELAFRRADFAGIRPEAALVLCTDDVALPPSPLELGSDQDPASSLDKRKKAKPVFKERPQYDVRQRNSGVRALFDRLATPRELTEVRREDLLRTWVDADIFYHMRGTTNLSRAVKQNPYFPASIPFLFRARGRPLRLADCASSECYEGQTGAEGGAAAADTRLPASAFFCYSGQPRLTRQLVPGFVGADDDRTLAVPSRLRKRLRPLSADEAAAVVVCRHRSERHLQSSRAASAASTESAADMSDSASFLQPYRSSYPRRVAYFLFRTYFNHLGVLCNGVRITGETPETSVPELPITGPPCVWDLCPEADYSVEEEVERKRVLTYALWSNAAEMPTNGCQFSTTLRSLGAASQAFSSLLLSDRNRLLRRLHALNVYLHTITHNGGALAVR